MWYHNLCTVKISYWTGKHICYHICYYFLKITLKILSSPNSIVELQILLFIYMDLYVLAHPVFCLRCSHFLESTFVLSNIYELSYWDVVDWPHWAAICYWPALTKTLLARVELWRFWNISKDYEDTWKIIRKETIKRVGIPVNTELAHCCNLLDQ